MNTRNWQIKILTLCMAAIALCLTAACESTDPEYAGPQRITPSAPCGDDVPLTQSVEFSRLPENAGITEIGLAAMARAERLRPEIERIQAILDKYEDLIRRQPNVLGYNVNSMRKEDGEITDKQIIGIAVEEYVDQSTFPPEDRIPECMEGVEVHFKVVGNLEATTD